jgi:hypothetical protein
MGQGDLGADSPLDNDYLISNSLSLGHLVTNNSMLKAETSMELGDVPHSTQATGGDQLIPTH